jgi:hypothetical protein
MVKIQTVARLALVVLGVTVATTAGAAESPKPSGKVAVESKSIAAGIGVSWGDGKLDFKGKEYQFSIEGLTLVDVGFSKASAVGEVYDLKEVGQFEGTYVAGEAGFALAGGMGGISLRNQNGVVMHLRSVTQGAKLQLGTSGLTIKLKQ